ncbi:MAG: class I SAM-dependent methyltransferase [Ktedonobacteraceae bacterium]
MDENNTYVIRDSETELARLQLQGSLFDEVLPMFPHLFQPDQHSRASILDLGFGPGGWVLQVAQAYPEYKIVGIDVNPRMVAYAQAQANVQELDVQFREMDLLHPFNFADGSFDLVNLRLGAGFLPVAKAPAVYQECWRVLKPGGVIRNIEHVHMSMPYASSSPLALASFIFQALYTAGLTYNASEMCLSAGTARVFQDIGFHPIELVPHILDISAGTVLHSSMFDDMRIGTMLLKPFVVDQMHMCSAEEFDHFFQDTERIWKDPRFCAHWYLCSVCGVKPEHGQA